MDILPKTSCNSARCQVVNQCPYAPAETCQLEEEFMEIALEWANTLPGGPLTRLRVDTMLQPLFRQYFWLRLEQRAISNKEIRDVIRVLDFVIHSIKSQSNNH